LQARRRNTSLSLQKKLSFAKSKKKIKAIATLLEILEGNFFYFGNEEAKQQQQQQRIDLN
jgi:hypothetical protein